jgi:hypothetical protein
VSNRRRGSLQIEEELGATDLVEEITAAELFGDGDDVDGLAGDGEDPHRLVDVLVRGLVEVRRAETRLGNAGQRVLGQQERAEQRRFGVEVVRWYSCRRRPSPPRAHVRHGSATFACPSCA